MGSASVGHLTGGIEQLCFGRCLWSAAIQGALLAVRRHFDLA